MTFLVMKGHLWRISMKQNRQKIPWQHILPFVLSAAVALICMSGCTIKDTSDLPPWVYALHTQFTQFLNGPAEVPESGSGAEMVQDQDTGIRRLDDGSLLFSDGASFSVQDGLPEYAGEPFVQINEGIPHFEKKMLTGVSRETYGELDAAGRCTSALACLGTDLMPQVERGSIGMIRPTGWKTVRYDFIDGMYLYNRCHLIGYQLAGENLNERNLITGTRYLNIEGMLPFENKVGSYIRRTGQHVLYRATPVFAGDELLARGVLLEAESVEDGGAAIQFCVYCFNVQPGVWIDYRTGDNHAS